MEMYNPLLVWTCIIALVFFLLGDWLLFGLWGVVLFWLATCLVVIGFVLREFRHAADDLDEWMARDD